MSFALGPDSKINTTSTGNQFQEISTRLVNGGYVVVWESNDLSQLEPNTIFQIFDDAGNPVGGEVMVNDVTIGRQQPIDVTALVSGGFVVTFRDNSTGDSLLMQAAYDKLGVEILGPRALNGGDTDGFRDIDVLATADGGWAQAYQDDGHSLFVFEAFDDAGEGSLEPLNFVPGIGVTLGSTLVSIGGGGWLFVYSNNENSLGTETYFQFITDEGVIATPPENLHPDFHAGTQRVNGAVQLADGGFAVVYYSFGQDGDSGGVYVQKLSSKGAFETDAIQVNEIVKGSQSGAQIFAQSDGGFIVTYESETASDGTDLFVKGFNADGSVKFDSIRVHDVVNGNQQDARVAVQADGSFVVAWEDYASGTDINLRAFDANGNPLGDVLDAHLAAASNEPSTSVFANSDGTYTLTYGRYIGPNDYDLLQRTLTVTPDLPTSHDVTVTMDEDTVYSFTGDEFVYDDPGDLVQLTLEIAEIPSSGELRLDGVLIEAAISLTPAQLNLITWAPNADAFGDALDSFAFYVTNSAGSSYLTYEVTFRVTDIVDVFSGNRRKDVIEGTEGSDIIKGKAGKDSLFGHGGDDTVQGDKGRDRIEGGAGNDVLMGKGGKDKFVFYADFGDDVIKDFKAKGPGQEKIVLGGVAGIETFADLKANHMDRQGRDVLITDNDGNTILLQDVKMRHLNSADFSFVDALEM